MTTDAQQIYPTFRFRDATAMIQWLEQAFGFNVHAKHMAGDKVAHAELAFGSSIIMCGDDKDDPFGELLGNPSGSGGKSIYIAVDDADAMFTRAKAAGAAIEQDLTDRDYGSREFICRDPEGNLWCIGTYCPKAEEKA